MVKNPGRCARGWGTGADCPVRGAAGYPASPILTGSHADLPVAVARVLVVVTPFFGGSAGWPSLAAPILAAALVIPFVLSKRG